MQTQAILPTAVSPSRDSARLHYLDWLRVLAILGVFLFHAVHPFDLGDWHIKNAEQSLAITIVLVLFGFWGMPFFFLIAGTGTWFALRRRTARQYATERFRRLLVPFIVGSILFMPIMLYLDWLHNTRKGAMLGSFIDFVTHRNVGFSPRWFGALGYHLWFLGFLFCFSLLALPLFLWLKGESGRRFILWLARLSEHRGAILLFVLPLLAVQLSLRPFFPIEHDWADFFLQMSFFVLGFVLFTDEGFARAIRRDGWIILAAALAALGSVLALFAFGQPFDWAEMPASPQFYLVWSLVTANGLYWSLFLLYIGMRFLDFSNAWLQYGQEAVLPFFMLHQPAIIVIAFFVVQWNAGIPVKMLAVVVGSFMVCLALYEFVIRRSNPLRSMFGMTTKRVEHVRVQMS